MHSIVISGESFDGPDVVAGWSLFKKLKKFAKKAYKVAKKYSPAHRLGIHKLVKKYGRKALKYAAPALGVASIAMPWLAPAAIAAKLAQRVMKAARRGKKAARFAMRMFGRDAGRGNRYSRGMMRMMQRMRGRRRSRARRPWRRRARGWTRRFNPRMLRQMAVLARRGDMRAAGVMDDLAGNAEAGDPECQALLKAAGGTEHWNDGQHANVVHAAPAAAPDAVAGRFDVLGLQDPAYSVAAGYDRVIVDGATLPVINDPNANGYWNVVAGRWESSPPGGTTQVVAGLDRPPGGTVQVVAGAFPLGGTYDVVAGRWISSPPGGTTQVVAGGPLWDALKPQMPYRPDNAPEFWGARDAYKEGITAIPPGRY